jgi:beta-glucosidase
MPWANKVAGIVQAWYGGNEAGNAIADVLYGRRNPSGRLPITLPKREQDVPAYTDFKSEKGIVSELEPPPS